MTGPRDALAGFPLLTGLDENSIVALDRICVWRRAAAGEWILDHETEGTEVFFIPRGHVRVVLTSAGRDIILRDIRDGEFFGELAAIDARPRSAGIVAITDSLIARLSAGQFLALVQQNPDVCHRLLEHLVRQIRMLANRVNEHTNFGVRERLCAELLRLAVPGAERTMAKLSPPPTHLELAGRIGSNREAVTRELNAMARQGLIERRRGAIILRDAGRLRALIDARADR